ncbi:MAG: outer membrane lipoprotein chaperone LolA [Burkholderiales bacterium]
MKRGRIHRVALGLMVLLAGLSGSVWSSGLEQLKRFVQDTQSGQAQFTQTSLGTKSSSSGQNSSGLFQFSRPGKFRWEYQKPYPQTIVGDGHTLWIWDPDLKQVTRKKLNESLGSTPAAILAGDNALEKGFRLEEGGTSEGLEWVMATPKTAESGFERIRLGFDASSLARMELQDSFGHIITIRFAQFNKAPHFAPDTFRFTPPPGADVIQ